jgi:hypothetical protein
MLSYDPERQTYAPGLRLVRLAHAAWQASSLAPIARPYLDELSRATGETVHLAQLDGGQVLYVDKRNAADPVEMYSQAGKVGPAYCTGVGKAMLALPARGRSGTRPATAGLASVHALRRSPPPKPCVHGTCRNSRARACLRRRGARTGHHLRCGADPHPLRSGSGGCVGNVDHDRHRSCGSDEPFAGDRRAVSAIAGEAQDWRFPDQAAE